MEDFINSRSLKIYAKILNMLKKYDFEALFFVTGHMAEKLGHFPLILKMLEPHEIGYHSSSHSVRPTIFEYTDIESYDEAYAMALERETAHINPFTGEAEGSGGIEFLRELFPNKSIIAFRAPGCAWSPPHLEALKKLGIKFDFSALLSSRPVHFKGITFYPYPIAIDGFISYRRFSIMLNRGITVIASHPDFFGNSKFWDFAYHMGNPSRLFEAPERNVLEARILLWDFELLLKQIKFLEKLGLVEVSPSLNWSNENLKPTPNIIERCYEKSVEWPWDFFGYKPKFLRSHFSYYFGVPL
jgi:peptidoglycan/xylan/chitin deacetylase (PgdA/CDA1 family)